MSLQKYDPFAQLFRFRDVFNRTFEDSALDASRGSWWTPAVDVYEDTERMTFKFDVPGIRKEDLHLKVEQGVLTVEGSRKLESEERKDNYHRVERSFGTFARSFSLPTTVDSETVSAELKDGVLRITLQKKPEAQPRTIEIH